MPDIASGLDHIHHTGVKIKFLLPTLLTPRCQFSNRLGSIFLLEVLVWLSVRDFVNYLKSQVTCLLRIEETLCRWLACRSFHPFQMHFILNTFL